MHLDSIFVYIYTRKQNKNTKIFCAVYLADFERNYRCLYVYMEMSFSVTICRSS